MSDLIAIQGSNLPAHLQGKTGNNNLFAAAVQVGGFPVVSIKGKVFHIQRGDVRKLVTKDGEDDPAGSLQVVILAANPNKSKVYYDKGFEEGSVAKPTCYSNNGSSPASDAESPQSKNCATCPHNQWGSRITDNGGKGKACGDSMRICIAPAGQLNDPMLLRVPAASLKVLGQYGLELSKRGVLPHHVITKISFDHNVAHPALTFKAVEFVNETQLAAIEDTLNSEAELINQITGVTESPNMSTEAVADSTPAKVEVVEEVKVEAPKKAEPKKEAKKVEDFDDVDAALDNLDFDD